MQLATPPLLTRLEGASHVLLAGAGGGYDVFASIPLATHLLTQGKRVTFANLTFTYLGGTDADYVAPHVARVTPDTVGEDRYFPERSLSRWLRSRELDPTVYALEKVGVRPLTAAYRHLVAHTGADAIVLVDGGTDILMRGDEAGLGTPQEDIASLAAVHALSVPTKLVACLGFGVDTFHGVCHAHFLENTAALDREGAFLGAFSVPRASHEGAAYLDAVESAHRDHPARVSIVNASIAAALRGDFGDVPLSERTRGSELFINPLMTMYFGYELDAVARRCVYLPLLKHTESIFDVSLVLEGFRHEVSLRPRRSIPH
ncbi:MAG: DUF1152 domain-containing protein [Sandaracinaceae bacterium]|nr:DUF1152 domain-containing protein [Sandaracinaceae bacterium]